MTFQVGQINNPTGRPKRKYDLLSIPDRVLDKFGGLQAFIAYWYDNDKRYLSDYMARFLPKSINITSEHTERLISLITVRQEFQAGHQVQLPSIIEADDLMLSPAQDHTIEADIVDIKKDKE
jgi:hypothetical protein